nr:hypothetical protein [Tanacetum cinerariifolium]
MTMIIFVGLGELMGYFGGNLDTTQAQQKALDDALVALANRLKIRKCNLRLISTSKSKEPTLKVVLDALKLTPFYKAFEITADVLEIYMQELTKYVQKKADSETSPKKKPIKAPKGKRLKATAKVPKSRKKKLHAQGLETLSKITLSEAEQMKIATKRSMTQFHVSHASRSGDDDEDDDADNQGDDDQDDDNEQTTNERYTCHISSQKES